MGIYLDASTVQLPRRRGPVASLLDRLDRKTAEADQQAWSFGLDVREDSRFQRTYRDPRCEDLRTVREAGCQCVPICHMVPGRNLPACRVPGPDEAA